ncbi:MAG: ATP-dependent helicase, partial [Candidatus Omnitrophota bacterium]
MIEIQKELNPTQYAAASTIEGPLLVIAGAGSGKTRVIEYRVLHLVQSEIAPSSILLLTFTKRASREMLGRAAKHDPRCERVDGGTFHSFCYKMLRHYAKTIGFNSAFSILDESDSGDAVHRCAVKLGLHDREKRFPKKRTLKGILSMSINKNTSIKDILSRQYPHFIKYAPDIEELRNKYAEYKITKNLMDYDDLLVYFRLVLQDEAIRQKIAGKYKYIMVDEYQDTNLLQGDITYLMAKEHKNIMVVGDDAQSIYGFRGASHDNIMKFPKQFAGCKIMKLEENYRSTQAILDVGNAILANMKNKFSKTLVSARMTSGEKPEMLYFKDAYKEAEWIARRIKDLYDEGVELAQQAVLFRNLYISIPLQAELNKRNIPYHVFGGMKFNETAHVKDVIAHLKVIANPKDELSWTRILTL